MTDMHVLGMLYICAWNIDSWPMGWLDLASVDEYFAHVKFTKLIIVGKITWYYLCRVAQMKLKEENLGAIGTQHYGVFVY